jgi:hypothetical protein
MRTEHGRAERARLRRSLNKNRDQILLSLETEPEAVESREPMWRTRHDLLHKLETLT